MITLIWILKGIIALIFITAGINKIFLPKTKLLDKGMKGLTDIDEREIKIAGLLEILGALGLTLNTYPVLCATAALCLALTMIVAGWINFRHKLPLGLNIVIFIFCVFIARMELKLYL